MKDMSKFGISKLSDKVTKAKALIAQTLAHYKDPCVLCSFGKDSVLMLYLVRQYTHQIPVVFMRHPLASRKYAYAHRIQEEWNLDIYGDVPPVAVRTTMGNGEFDIINFYKIGAKTIALPVGVMDPDPRAIVCGKDKLLCRPVGSFNWPWDAAFHGHKACDKDPLKGDIPIFVDVHQVPGICALSYPLRDFTDQDVLECFEEFKIPIHEERYVKINGKWTELADKSFNPDYVRACTACFDPRNDKVVSCPKMGGVEVTNFADEVLTENPCNLNYMQR